MDWRKIRHPILPSVCTKQPLAAAPAERSLASCGSPVFYSFLLEIIWTHMVLLLRNHIQLLPGSHEQYEIIGWSTLQAPSGPRLGSLPIKLGYRGRKDLHLGHTVWPKWSKRAAWTCTDTWAREYTQTPQFGCNPHIGWTDALTTKVQ